MSSSISMASQDNSMARPRVSCPLYPSPAQSLYAQQLAMTTSIEKVANLKPNGVEIRDQALKGEAEVQDSANVIDVTPVSAKFDRQASRARIGELCERSEKLKAFIFESQLFCAQASWRAEEVRMQVMDPELRKTCERVAQVRQRAAQLETEAAVRRGDKLQVELDEAKEKLSTFVATEQQIKLQLVDCAAQLEDVRQQVRLMQVEKEEQTAAVRREAAASQVELEALREQLRLAQQQVAQQQVAQQQVAQQEHYVAAAAAAATTTAATVGTTTTPSAAEDVDLELVHALSPIVTCAAPANWLTIASSAGEDALWKEVNELRAQLVGVQADGRDSAARLRAVEGKCDAVLGALDAIKRSAHSTPASCCGRRAPAAATTPSPSPCVPAPVGVMTRSQTRARKGLFSPPAPASGKRTQRDDGSGGNDDDVVVKRLRTD